MTVWFCKNCSNNIAHWFAQFFLLRVFLMESDNCPQNCSGLPYFPPPLPWKVPISVSYDNNDTPWWDTPRSTIVIIAIVAIIVVGGFLLKNRHVPKETAASPEKDSKTEIPSTIEIAFRHEKK
ncbi:uncharacterized protein LOC130137549 [Syzygium oleosum]|uniref:uncharacterized protein LOC130137549 n=1 Tax=Syzygium oleosum TaxID=219896 RepID=UPI0024BBDC6C|nr:uncharacterized protein LOC130137549 [Syzygium oleosum]